MTFEFETFYTQKTHTTKIDSVKVRRLFFGDHLYNTVKNHKIVQNSKICDLPRRIQAQADNYSINPWEKYVFTPI